MATKSKPMQKQTKVVLIVILVLALLWFYFRRDKNETTATSNLSDSSGGGGTGTGTNSGLKDLGHDTILKKGSKGLQVKWLQELYNSKYAEPKGLTKLATDGIFGAKTESAVKGLSGKTSISWGAWRTFLNATPSSSFTSMLTDWAKI